MEILVTGRGGSGAWQVRGIQLGRAMGVSVTPEAQDLAAHGIVVLVKRYTPDLLARIHAAREASGARIVWDVVDAWPQPEGNDWTVRQCQEWLRGIVLQIKPNGIVAATRDMSKDLKHFGIPTLWLPHHARPGLRRNPIRDEVRTVGYEGAEHYITRWRPIIEAECEKRGWSFVVNPAELADVDIVLALRDSTGYAPRSWKSGVKLANAQGSGTPVVCCREAGYLETDGGGAQWADNPEQLRVAFDVLTPQAARRNAAAKLLAGTLTLEDIADKYSSWLHSNFSEPTNGR